MSASDSIEFSCPSCHTALRVPAQLAGVTGPCPHCGASIAAPNRPAIPPAQFPQTPPAQNYQTPPAQNYQAPPAQTAPQPVRLPDQPSAPAAPQPSSQKRRKMWPTVLFSTAFVTLAVATSVLVLDLMQIIDIKKYFSPKQNPDASATETLTTIKQPQTPPQSDPTPPLPTKIEEPAITEKPEPTPVPLEHSPEDLTKPGEIPVELPPLVDESRKKVSQAVADAEDVVKRFLSAKTFIERKPYLAQSKHSDEELAASCLGGILPFLGVPRLLKASERTEDRTFEAFFSVNFDQTVSPVANRSMLVFLRTIQFSEAEPPKIHVDPFLDLYEARVAKFAATPKDGIATFHSLIEYSHFCYADIPRASKMAEISFYQNNAHGEKPLATAYLSKDSQSFKTLIESGIKPGTRMPCTISLVWDRESDPNKPFLQVARIDALNWEF